MIQAQLPDGTMLEFPEGTSDEVIQRVVRQQLGVQSPAAPAAAQPAPQQGGGLLQQLGNLGAGALRGAGSIGATLLTPVDMAARALGVQNSFIGRDDRRQAMTEGLRSMGADPESLAFQGGKIAAEIAGTAALPGAAANTVGRVAPAAAAPLVQALRTGGMARDLPLAARVIGGAAAGGMSAGLVNPEEAGTGALIGGGLPVAGEVVRGVGKLGRNVLGMTTGAGDESLRVAYESGKAGGDTARAFRENMRGQVPVTDVLDDARANLEALRQARSAAYRQNMAAVKADKAVLDMNPVGQSVQDSVRQFTFKGQAKDPAVLQALQQVDEAVSAWRQLDPAEFHTPEGLDALKQQIGSIRDSLPIESRSSRAAVDNVYNSVKRQIERQAPEYAKAMRDYTEASDLITEVQKSLLGNDRTSADTALRKLQSLMRNNVNTNYGARLQAAQALEAQGGREIMPQLAGQQLNDFIPRGIQRGTGALTALGAGSVAGIPAAVGSLAASSPRLVGETMYGAGRIAGAADPLVQALRQGVYRAAPVIGAQ